MPYVITTTPRPTHAQLVARIDGVELPATRTAVPTLEEAREHIRPMLPAGVADLFSVADGGTIGPLPDGTVIDVRRMCGWCPECNRDILASADHYYGCPFRHYGIDHPEIAPDADTIAHFNANAR